MRGCQAPFGTPLAVSKVEEDRGDDEECTAYMAMKIWKTSSTQMTRTTGSLPSAGDWG